MGILFTVAAFFILAKLALELGGLAVTNANMTSEQRALRDAKLDNRKAYIIEDGLRKHTEWQRNHPVRGKLFKYDAQKYWRDNQLNYKRYPL